MKIKLSTTQIILLGFLITIIIGSILLSLPVSSADGDALPFIDALFTATTATCVTGLVTVTTATSWSVFGQSVILVLIQIGGLGVITVMSALMMIVGKKMGLNDRILVMDAFNINTMSGIGTFIKKVVLGSFIIEFIGALCYMTVFIPQFGLKGIWFSVFNSVSAFCNAGMDIVSENSLYSYISNPTVNITTMLLIILGGLGFTVWWDVAKKFRHKGTRHFKNLTLHSKIALSATAFLILSGAALIFIFEYSNAGTIGNLGLPQKVQASFFQSVTTRTAGFATFPQENMTNASSLLCLLLMFIGGSPVGTAGGIKTVTFFILLFTTSSVIKNNKDVTLFNRRITESAVKKAVAVCTVSFMTLFISTVLMTLSSNGVFLDILYETVSATATVGLSRSFTATLGTFGKIIIIFTMYFGRVGPISIMFALKSSEKKGNIIQDPSEEISIG